MFFAFNHLFMLFDDQMAVESYVRQALTLAPGFETRNGAMLAEHNEIRRGTGRVPAIGRTFRSRLVAVTPTSFATWERRTETAGRTREEFLANLVEAERKSAEIHGGRQRLLAEIYGSIVNHWGGILGFKRHEITVPERLIAIVCSALLLPFQFIPASSPSA